ncbi:hypothetical protein [uncultured Stenotrophomonas sp.]|uniref:hypothetical protein n=1 Tax=uncultured Stenotrophomonas sp. TaxID=165438 RepID=UPI0025EDA4EB|nr:hypothetical protein [uncultured Stenotrophomonas sp.]
MSVEEDLTTWLAATLREPRPASLRGYCFNLVDGAAADEASFTLELVGCERFDANDPDWPCDECWRPSHPPLEIATAFTGPDWESCLENVRGLLLPLVQEGTPGAPLRMAQGVGLGFVDGDLHLLWQRGE